MIESLNIGDKVITGEGRVLKVIHLSPVDQAEYPIICVTVVQDATSADAGTFKEELENFTKDGLYVKDYHNYLQDLTLPIKPGMFVVADNDDDGYIVLVTAVGKSIFTFEGIVVMAENEGINSPKVGHASKFFNKAVFSPLPDDMELSLVKRGSYTVDDCGQISPIKMKL